jgi:hypothetical protein
MKDWLKQLLTKIFSNGFLALLIIAVLYILWLRECKRVPECPTKGMVMIEQHVWDSIKALANKPAIVHIDTIKGPTVYVPIGPNNPPPQPQPDPADTTINKYSDSLIKVDVHVHYDFRVKGTLLDRSWSYNPITIHRTDSIPYPVYIKGDPYEVKISQRGLYVYGSAGGNSSAFLFGGGVDYITKMNTEVGYHYQRFGNQNFHNIKVGVKLFNKNK